MKDEHTRLGKVGWKGSEAARCWGKGRQFSVWGALGA